jgi:hypothetical protein
MGPQFIVIFRGVEVGRYETAEWAVAAAQSVIDTELGARFEPATGAPHDLPQIFWQPPPMHFPFDAKAYWTKQASRVAPQYPPRPIGNEQFRGAPPPPPDPAPMRGPATVYGGPPAPARDEPPAPDYGVPAPYEQALDPAYPPQAPVYGGPPAPSR